MAVENQTLGQSMIRLFMGYIPTRVIYVAAKLELTDHVGDAEQARKTSRKNSKLIQQPCIVSCACSQALGCCAKMTMISST
jgi:hypothetical protein